MLKGFLGKSYNKTFLNTHSLSVSFSSLNYQIQKSLFNIKISKLQTIRKSILKINE